MSEFILAIDPGGTTGIAVKDRGDQYNTFVCKDEEELWELFRSPPTLVIIENFVAELISKYGLYTVQLVGGVKALCYLHNIPLVIQMPQKRIAFVKEAKQKLKDQGYRFEIHEADALAHLLAYEYWSAKQPAVTYHYDIRSTDGNILSSK